MVREILERLVAPRRAEQGQVEFSLYASPSDATRFVVFGIWASDAHHQADRSTEHLLAFPSKAPDVLDGPTAVTKWSKISWPVGFLFREPQKARRGTPEN
jgi:quinol monooxygenase YgiN